MGKRPDSVAKVRREAVTAAKLFPGTLPGDDEDAMTLVLSSGVVLRDLAHAYVHDAIAAARRDLALQREREAQAEREREWIERQQTPEAIEERRRSEEAYQQRLREIDERMWAEVRRTTERYAADLRMQWTQELLETGFALGDGRIVTWAAATVGDHQQRIDMLQRNAVGNLEAAARHQAAVAEIEAAGVPTLGDLVREVAA